VLLGTAVVATAATTVSPPPRVEREFDLDSRREAVVPWLARQPESRVIASKTRRALALETSAGPVSLWVAPTRSGGECWLVDIQAVAPSGTGGACSPRPVRTDFVIRPWQSETRVGDATLRLLSARVTPDVSSVEIRFADGRTDEVQPAGTFFVRELRDGEDPQLVIARGDDGTELRRRSMPGPRSFRRDLPFPTAPYRKVIELETSAGYPMTFAVAPGTNGSACRRTSYRGAQAWGCGPGPTALAPDELSVHPGLWNESDDGKPVALLEGSVGRSIARLEVWYVDGGAARIPVVDQYVLFEVPRRRVPRLLVGFDAEGSLVARSRLN
jgi:hypothetical protein